MFTFADAKISPGFLLHAGDTIYADGVILPKSTRRRKSGRTSPSGEGKVAETLDEFRAAHKYNFLDDHLRAFNAEVPIFVQWTITR
jgi:alkaline phosphatase D